MCATPQISLGTAVFEWFTAGYILLRYSGSRLARDLAMFIIILGLYQFTEYMMCVTSNFELWGRIGVATYTILPAAGLSFTLAYTKFRHSKLLIYTPMAIFMLIALFSPDFVLNGACGRYFVSLTTQVTSFSQSFFLTAGYSFYYTLYLILACLFLFRRIRQSRRKRDVFVHILIMSTIISTILAPFILVVLIPSLSISFPSIYCQFAILFTITALIGLRKDYRGGKGIHTNKLAGR